MGLQTTATPGLSSTRYDQYFTKLLLKYAVEQLQLVPLAEKFQLPKNAGSTTLRMYKRSKADPSRVKTLTEGTPDANYSETTLSPVDVVLSQIGDKAKISDVLTETSIFNQLEIEVKAMGEACAVYNDRTLLTAAITGNQAAAATQRLFAQGLASFATLTAATAAAGKLTCADLKRAATRLKLNRAPKFSDGNYVAVVTPEQSNDLMDDDAWKDVNVRNQSGKALYKGEIGTIYGVRVVETTVGWIEKDTQGTYDATGGIFTALVFGAQTLGTADLAGSPTAFHPKFTYLDKADKTDPLNQFRVAAWKGYQAAKLLDDAWLVSVRSKATAV